MSARLSYYVYSQIPGIWKNWTLAVLAVSRSDANNYVRSWHHGGKFSHYATSGTVKADCGGVTSSAQEIIHEEFEAWMNKTE